MPPQGPGSDAVLRVSARTGAGLDALHAWLREAAAGPAGGEGATGAFSARARQVDALRQAAAELAGGRQALAAGSLDLAAEALRAAHDALGEVTGRIVPDALLGHIFSTFCIGK
jgi:tRNA modification GTPase